MKTIIVLSGVLAMCVSGANAATDVINGNLFYGPEKGRFYNILTPIEFDTKWQQFYLRDEFGYGITDDLTVVLSTTGSYDSSGNPEFGKWVWNDLQLGLDWSVVSQGENRADLYARVEQVYDMRDGWDIFAYKWSLGTHFGRVTNRWTLAGLIQLDYITDDKTWYDNDAWAMTVGLFGQYLIDSRWSLIAELDFDFDLHHEYYDGERLELELGVNYNLGADKYFGLYTSKDVTRDFDDAPMKFKFQFGIEF